MSDHTTFSWYTVRHSLRESWVNADIWHFNLLWVYNVVYIKIEKGRSRERDFVYRCDCYQNLPSFAHVGIGEGVSISACYSATTPPPSPRWMQVTANTQLNVYFLFILSLWHYMFTERIRGMSAKMEILFLFFRYVMYKIFWGKKQQLTILIRRLIVKRLVCVGLNEGSTGEHRVLLNRFVDPAWGWVQRKEDTVSKDNPLLTYPQHDPLMAWSIRNNMTFILNVFENCHSEMS